MLTQANSRRPRPSLNARPRFAIPLPSFAPECDQPPHPFAPASRAAEERFKLPPVWSLREHNPTGPPTIQRTGARSSIRQESVSQRPNNTGLPDHLKSGIESLSGMSLDNVKVHYNSAQPAQISALAYTRGSDIHVAPGQKHHLPHEAWHVVQQAQGRVQPQMHTHAGIPVNNDDGLENEADVLGVKALGRTAQLQGPEQRKPEGRTTPHLNHTVVQRKTYVDESQMNPADKIKQTEGKRTPWHGPGPRDSKLSEKIEQFKKEMLTWIANKIQTGSKIGKIKDTKETPHVAVVITGDTCYVAINSVAGDFDKENFKEDLEETTREVLTEVKNYFADMDARYRRDPAEATYLSEKDKLEQEALYVTLRWVEKVNHVNADLERISGKPEGTMHGEMLILAEKFNRTNPLGGGPQRVLRVGGTKIPCYDCGKVMGVHGGAQSDPHSSIKFVLDHKDQVRRVWTMQHKFGKSFLNWYDPLTPYHTTKAMSFPTSPDFEKNSNQSATELQSALPPVIFSISFRSNSGQNLFIVGNTPKLGNWDPDKAVALTYRGPDTWGAAVNPGKTQSGEIQYKYLVKEGTSVRWEEGGNHRHKLSGGGVDKVNDIWHEHHMGW